MHKMNVAPPLTWEEKIQNGKNIHFKDTIFEETVDFVSLLESYEVNTSLHQVKVNGALTFENCVFQQGIKAFEAKEGTPYVTSVIFDKNVTFVDCVFQEHTNFRGARFRSAVDFSRSIFIEGANFEGCSFFENSFFVQSEFRGEARFQNTLFINRINLKDAIFRKSVSFQNGILSGEGQFSGIEFIGYADFSLLDARDRLFFNYVKSLKFFDMSNSICMQDLDFIGSEIVQLNATNCRFYGDVCFQKTKVAEKINFQDSRFLIREPDLGVLDKKKWSR